MKKYLSMFLAILMLVSLIPGMALATETGEEAESQGTEGNPTPDPTPAAQNPVTPVNTDPENSGKSVNTDPENSVDSDKEKSANSNTPVEYSYVNFTVKKEVTGDPVTKDTPLPSRLPISISLTMVMMQRIMTTPSSLMGRLLERTEPLPLR